MQIFLTGVIVGCTITLALIGFANSSYHSMAKNAIVECEKTLPRDQICTVIAIPKTGVVK